MTPQETFITRLRRHRERNHISLEEIVSQTRIKREQLEAFERGDLRTGRAAFTREPGCAAYASIIGLDPIDTVDEFCKLFPHGDRGRSRRSAISPRSSRTPRPTRTSSSTSRTTTGAVRRTQVDVPPSPTWREQMARLVRSLLSLRPARSPRAVRSMRAN